MRQNQKLGRGDGWLREAPVAAALMRGQPDWGAPGVGLAIGVDVGQVRDPSAIAAVEWLAEGGYGGQRVYRVRHLERLALGSAFGAVVERVRRLTAAAREARELTVVVDATGVGAPVAEMLARGGLGARVEGVVITGGEPVTWSNGRFHVPKKELIGQLTALVESGRLKIPRGMRESGALVREMAAFEMKRRRGRPRYEGKEGEHDDLVIAVALACWWGCSRV